MAECTCTIPSNWDGKHEDDCAESQEYKRRTISKEVVFGAALKLMAEHTVNTSADPKKACLEIMRELKDRYHQFLLEFMKYLQVDGLDKELDIKSVVDAYVTLDRENFELRCRFEELMKKEDQ